MAFGPLFYKHRIIQGLSQEQVARRVGIGQGSYSSIEKNGAQTQAQIFMRIVRLLKISQREIFEWMDGFERSREVLTTSAPDNSLASFQSSPPSSIRIGDRDLFVGTDIYGKLPTVSPQDLSQPELDLNALPFPAQQRQ